MRAARYHVTDLGTLGGPESQAKKINDLGQIIGCSDTKKRAEPGDLQTPFLWENGSFKNLGGFVAADINNFGDIVGTHLDLHRNQIPFDRSYAMIYRRGKARKLLKLPYRSHAVAINDNGDVLGFWYHGKHDPTIGGVTSSSCIFIWNAGDVKELWRSTDNLRAIPVDINNAGEILFNRKAGASDGNGGAKHAVLLADSKMIELGSLPGYTQSTAVAINNHRQVLCRAIDTNMNSMRPVMRKLIDEDASMEESKRAISDFGLRFSQKSFLWDKGIRTEIDGLMEDLNDHCQIVGWTAFSLDRPSAALIWQNGDLTNLNDLIDAESGWRLDKAGGINNQGQIVGYGKHAGVTRAFLLTPV